MKLLNIFFLIVVFSLAACGTKKQVVTTDTTTDSRKEVREVYRDTTIIAAPQSSDLQINVSALCDDYKRQKVIDTSVAKDKPESRAAPPKQYQSQNGDAYVDAQLMDNLLTIRGGCDSIAMAAQIKQRFEKEYQNTNSSYNKDSKRGVSTFRLIYTSLIVGVIGIGIGVVASKFSII